MAVNSMRQMLSTVQDRVRRKVTILPSLETKAPETVVRMAWRDMDEVGALSDSATVQSATKGSDAPAQIPRYMD